MEKSNHKLRVAITGAAGNLGNLLARRMLGESVDLNLMIHKKELSEEISGNPEVSVFKVDLGDSNTLDPALKETDVVVHFAGVLFKANPEKFLPVTNMSYFKNLLDACVRQKVKRVILISFPHTEGETTPENPAQGRLDASPQSAHARTRLEEEKMLFDYATRYEFEPVCLRTGMVYGKGILMIDVAQWFARHGILGVWRKPTVMHLISKTDFLDATTAAILLPNVNGIYHLGDEGIQTLQTFLDDITIYASNRRPWRMPVWMIMTAARGFECFSKIFGTRSPLTVDFIRIGMVSYYGDTTRMRRELLPELKYRTYKVGMELF